MDRPSQGINIESLPQNPETLSLTMPNLSYRRPTPPLGKTDPFPPAAGPQSRFTLFPILPGELRLKIWEFALPGPRVVKIKAPQLLASGSRQAASALDFTSACAVPALLHVNAEARAVALRHYELSFATDTFPPRINFCFERDTLHFPQYVFNNGLPTPFFDAISSSERARTRSVTVDVERYCCNVFDLDKGLTEGNRRIFFNSQLQVEALRQLRELCWVMLEPLEDWRCSLCEDTVRTMMRGMVSVEDRREIFARLYAHIVGRTDQSLRELAGAGGDAGEGDEATAHEDSGTDFLSQRTFCIGTVYQY